MTANKEIKENAIKSEVKSENGTKRPPQKIDVKNVIEPPKKFEVKVIKKIYSKFDLIEELRVLSKTDFKQVIKAAKQIRRADEITEKAIGGIDE